MLIFSPHSVRRETLFSFQPFLLFQLTSLCLYSYSSLPLRLLSSSRCRHLYANDLFYSCCSKVLVWVNGLQHCGPMVSINGVSVQPTKRCCRYKNFGWGGGGGKSVRKELNGKERFPKKVLKLKTA